ncbi:PIN/TRAM domain-containing protein [Gimesia algae]|uniref:Putative PIN and TRAM-domain containing protein n=1 Tax=Gimesia algae TaxID=2527971 RepID=A0A517VKP4_9PLAN|nr:PIN domain-containing protein [Gimesia algae]QDT93557.1 putative PIN and TRAM-domain containing protein precursor [Gimesia algae]
MLLISIRVLYAFVCAGAIATFVSSNPPSPVDQSPLLAFVLLMILTQAVTCLDLLIGRKRIEVISAIYFGLLVGVLLSFLLKQALNPVISKTPWGEGVVMITTLTLPYLCISFLLQTKDDFRFIVPYVEFSRELKGGRPLVLDSSALIDGRIADVVETKILDSEMVVPDFILKEVQDIADSSDKVRRVRGRRGLDILSTLQNNPTVDISMYEAKETDKEKGLTVDQRLVVAAKKLGGKVVTNDFNLNKVASVQGVDVINLNDVANSLKPRYLPGEHIQLKIIKEGESQAQGVGYLDDGTMVVCEQANHLVGRDVDAVVTSVLQSSAGRMIFGRVTENR